MIYDASALLAVLGAEPGAERVLTALADEPALCSSVNFAEVITKLLDRGGEPGLAYRAWKGLQVTVVPVDEALALEAASLRESTRSLGLSLGDRCCLALARLHGGQTIVTADRAWKALKGYKFVFIR